MPGKSKDAKPDPTVIHDHGGGGLDTRAVETGTDGGAGPGGVTMGDVVIYQAADGATSLQVHLDHETVWLTQKQMAELFGKDVRTVNEHIRNIFKESELDESSVIRKFRITAADGKTYDTAHYNLDVIISVGYRVKSQQGTRFRQCIGDVPGIWRLSRSSST